MFVARRAYRNYNQMVLPGSVVEPGSTKWFKTRLKDRKIVEVNAHNFEEWSNYFKAKFGVTLRSLDEEPKDEEPKDEDPKTEDPNTDSDSKPAKVVTVVI